MAKPLIKPDQGRALTDILVRKRSKSIDATKRTDPDLNDLLDVVRANQRSIEKRINKIKPKKDVLERASKYL